MSEANKRENKIHFHFKMSSPEGFKGKEHIEEI